MHHIAILGATSQIAKDLILRLSSDDVVLYLYGRDIKKIKEWAELRKINVVAQNILQIDFFEHSVNYTAIINCVGIGSSKAGTIDASVYHLTEKYDDVVMQYLNKNASCKYLYLSSGGVHGDVYSNAHECRDKCVFYTNDNNKLDWYGLSKLSAEIKHRANSVFSIVDLRIYGYVSEFQDRKSPFFLSEMMDCILNGDVFVTTKNEMYRDYVHPDDLHRLVCKIINHGHINCAIECSSKTHASKKEILEMMAYEFGLKYRYIELKETINKGKIYYYPTEIKCGIELDYEPRYTSLESVKDAFLKIKKMVEKSND
jgi:nucleoside-diphosphate-sugar epimerase